MGSYRCQRLRKHVFLAIFEGVMTLAEGLPLRQVVPSGKLRSGGDRGFLECRGLPVGHPTSRPQAGDESLCWKGQI